MKERSIKAKHQRSLVEHLPLTEARNSLGAVVKRVHLGKTYVILEKDGIPLAGLMDIDEFEDYLDLQDPKIRASIAKGRAEYLAGKGRPARELLAHLLPKRGRVARRQTA